MRSTGESVEGSGLAIFSDGSFSIDYTADLSSIVCASCTYGMQLALSAPVYLAGQTLTFPDSMTMTISPNSPVRELAAVALGGVALLLGIGYRKRNRA